MKLKEDQLKLQGLLKETITLLCRSGLEYKSNLCVDAVIGITLDNDNGFFITIKDSVQTLSKQKKSEISEQETYDESDISGNESGAFESKARNKRLSLAVRKRKSTDIDTQTDGTPSKHTKIVTVEPNVSDNGQQSFSSPTNFDVTTSIVKEEPGPDEDNDVMLVKTEFSNENYYGNDSHHDVNFGQISQSSGHDADMSNLGEPFPSQVTPLSQLQPTFNRSMSWNDSGGQHGVVFGTVEGPPLTSIKKSPGSQLNRFNSSSSSSSHPNWKTSGEKVCKQICRQKGPVIVVRDIQRNTHLMSDDVKVELKELHKRGIGFFVERKSQPWCKIDVFFKPTPSLLEDFEEFFHKTSLTLQDYYNNFCDIEAMPEKLRNFIKYHPARDSFPPELVLENNDPVSSEKETD